jgi:hypothetical protein
MNTHLTRTLASTGLIFAGTLLGVLPAHASGVPSDELVVPAFGFDALIPELGGPEAGVIVNPNALINGATVSLAPAIAAGAIAVGLIDPPGPVDPGETCVPYQGSCLSDIVIAMQNAGGPPTIALFSDPNPVISDPNLPLAALIPLLETGTLQDMTPFLAPATGGIQVLAMSDVPVPGAVWLLPSALGLLGLRRKRTT